MAGSTFPARYRGACSLECGDPIEPGDEIMYPLGGGGLMHVICPDRVEERRGDICPSCFLELPLTGECPSC